MPVSIRHDIRAVYEVTHDKLEHGVGSGLYTIKAELGFYEKMGVSPDQLDLHAGGKAEGRGIHILIGFVEEGVLLGKRPELTGGV